jgi:EF-hand domain-containing protein 1
LIHQSDVKQRNVFFSVALRYDPALIYGRTKQQQVEPFRPHFVLFDKKTLKFSGFFRQHVPESRTEHYRIRHVNIFYYLEDDTITVIEPTVKVKIYDHVVKDGTKNFFFSK